MGEDISNKTLAVLLIAAIAVSLFGTFMVVSKPKTIITGMSTTGTEDVIFTVTAVTAITVVGSIDFGSGNVVPNNSSALVISDSNTYNATGWSVNSQIAITNVGNVAVNVSQSGTAASTFIGGSAATPKAWLNGTAGTGCDDPEGPRTWSDIEAAKHEVCGNLSYTPSSNAFDVYAKLRIPSDATGTSKTNTITFTAVAT